MVDATDLKLKFCWFLGLSLHIKSMAFFQAESSEFVI
jgi:hypothetical protein